MATTTQGNVGDRKMDQAREQFNQGKENLKDAASHGQQAAANAAQGIGQKVQNAANTATQKVQETASNLGHKAQDLASDLGNKAHDAASTLGDKAKDVASSAQDKTDDALTAVGEKVSSLAGSIRSSGPKEGMAGSTATALADKLDTTGRYLQEHGIGDIGNDLAGIVKSYPIPSLLAVFGVGFLAGMAARR
jgi:hypothetical protein